MIKKAIGNSSFPCIEIFIFHPKIRLLPPRSAVRTAYKLEEFECILFVCYRLFHQRLLTEFKGWRTFTKGCYGGGKFVERFFNGDIL